MNLENIQKKLFERKLDTTEYFKTAFDVYREFLKNNKQSTETKTSFAIIGNNSCDFKNLQEKDHFRCIIAP